MTTYTDHGLVCPDSGDYAAIALAMQADAVATDTALDTISDQFDRAKLRPYALWISTTSGTYATNGEAELTLFGNWAVVQTNMTSSLLTPSISGAVQFNPPLAGWYDFGVYETLSLVGAATANSRRTAFARAYSLLGSVQTLIGSSISRTYESSTGGEFLIASGARFYAQPGQNIVLLANLSHSNAASQVQYNVGCRIWCYYLGSGVEIGSA